MERAVVIVRALGKRVGIVGALPFVLATTLSVAARAEGEIEPIAVDYDAPATCPPRGAFFDELRARTSRARWAAAEERARVLIVRIQATDSRYEGQLVIDDAGRRSTARTVAGATCDEVVGALGLVAALALDPRASTAARPTPPPAAAPAPPRSPLQTAEPSAIRLPSSTPPFAAGAQMEASGIADAVLALRAFVGLDFGQRTLSPSIRVAVSRSFDVERVAPPGRAALRWTTGALDACPVRFDVSAAPTIEVRPCIGFAAGVLEAEAAAVSVPQSRTRPWLATSAHLRLMWVPVRWLAVELEGGAVAPLFRETFFFEPAIAVYEAPAVAAVGRAGVAVRFP